MIIKNKTVDALYRQMRRRFPQNGTYATMNGKACFKEVPLYRALLDRAVFFLWAICLGNTAFAEQENTAKNELVAPGVVKVIFHKDVPSSEVAQVLIGYGIKKEPGEFEYNTRELKALASGTAFVWRRSAAPPETQWLQLVVSPGQELFWTELLRADSRIRKTTRVTLESTRSAAAMDYQQISVVDNPTFMLRITGTSQEAFEQIEVFLSEHFKAPARTYSDDRYLKNPLFRVFAANHVKNAIVKKSWQTIRLAVGLAKTAENEWEAHGTIDGMLAPGMGTVPPELEDYPIPLLPTYAQSVQQFAAELKAAFIQFLKNRKSM